MASTSASSVPGALVTGTSLNHFAEMRGLIVSAQRYLPLSWQIVIYDLVNDLPESATLQASAWCGVQLRRFALERFPVDLDRRLLTVSMWKPFMIWQLLQSLPEPSVVIYADASTRFHEPLGAPLLQAVQALGVVGRPTAGPVAHYTHPLMLSELAKLGAVDRVDLHEYVDAPMLCGCLTLWSRKAVEQILRLWGDCAATRQCILPPGADGLENGAGLSKHCRPGLGGHCHRNDQSALSAILFDGFRGRNGSATFWRETFRSDDGATSSASAGAPYLRRASIGKETWHSGTARLWGTVVTTERANHQSHAPVSQNDSTCTRPSAAQFMREGVSCSWSNGCCSRHEPLRKPASCEAWPRRS